MEAKLKRPKGRDNALSALDGAIGAVNLAKGLSSSIAPAQAVFDIVGVILTTVRVSPLLFC